MRAFDSIRIAFHSHSCPLGRKHARKNAVSSLRSRQRRDNGVRTVGHEKVLC